MRMNAPPMNLQTLAAQYNLGRPLRLHRRPISLPLSLAALAGGPLCLIIAGLLGYMLFSAPRFNVSNLIGFLFVLGVGVALLITGISGLKYRRFQAWECEAGFLEL